MVEENKLIGLIITFDILYIDKEWQTCKTSNGTLEDKIRFVKLPTSGEKNHFLTMSLQLHVIFNFVWIIWLYIFQKTPCGWLDLSNKLKRLLNQ